MRVDSKSILAFLTACCMVLTAMLLRAQADLPQATVHVDAFNAFGRRIRDEDLHIHLFTTDRKRDLAQQIKGLAISNVPYGEYVLDVWDRGGGIAVREIAVNVKEIWIRIGLSFPAGNRTAPAGDLTITGDINPAPPDRADWWVRVEGVFLHASREAPILPRGMFSIDGLEMGTYLVEVFEGSKLRHVETVEIDPNKPVTQLKIAIPPVPR